MLHTLLREAIELLNQLANINGISALCQVGFKMTLILSLRIIHDFFNSYIYHPGNDIWGEGSNPNLGRD